MIIKSLAAEALQNPKAAHTIAVATVTTGVSTLLDWIPDDVGKLATLLGIVLTTVLIFTHIRRGQCEHEKAQLEIELLRRKLESEEDE